MSADPELTDDQKQTVAGYANRLPFVNWDRFTVSTVELGDDDTDTSVTLYGWVPRFDARFDFVVLTWHYIDRQSFPWSVTSSAPRSYEIGRLLYHDQDWWEPSQHVDCVRVQDKFDGLINHIVRV